MKKTLFLLSSIDGKISTGSSYMDDFDKDIPKMQYASKGLQQYYGIEKTTDLWCLNTGYTLVKCGVNTHARVDKQKPVTCVVLDNTHLASSGVRNLCTEFKRVIIMTQNASHVASQLRLNNLSVLLYNDLAKAFNTLESECGCDSITIQTGGTATNGLFRAKLIDYIDLVIAPLCIGGKSTPTISDGIEFPTELRLVDVTSLNDSMCVCVTRLLNNMQESNNNHVSWFDQLIEDIDIIIDLIQTIIEIIID